MSKKQLIMDRALELFANQGFEATSVQQITDHCGISKGAFYLSFKSKDELILEIINHFIQQITVDIDYAVNHSKPDEKLYHFFHTTFHAFCEHADFAKLLMKEHAHSFNEKLLEKLHDYDQRTDQILLSMLETVYGDKIDHIKYDLIFSIKGLINGYLNFLLFSQHQFDVDLVAKSLVEKTNLLARHVTIPFITNKYENMFQKNFHGKMDKHDLLQLIATAIDESDIIIEQESLILLKEQIIEPTFNKTILLGLIENIRNNPQHKWLAYNLKEYFN
ncbi:TetR/AcrR family transcriptional regulator [Ornithinibacillus scapharcae]|uniref:TetR/AcrR family transcriptional regulator n=1 Tax=Ornithinibacillus scapharcae TaxID=1147159 RepID=UPI000225BABD|nr:TetR/AcrR family transcriptional regulator [Ornithinibacillus scapharcae]